MIEKFHGENPLLLGGVKLPENRGQQNALLCALFFIKDHADVTVTIDADLQDDVDAIDKMLECFLSGAEIVFGVHSGREADGFFKGICARLYYGFMHFLGAGIVDNHADFRLMGGKALEALAEHRGETVFLRGIVPTLGFKTRAVHSTLRKRPGGKSKYSFQKLLRLAFDGIVWHWGRNRRKKHSMAKHRPKYTIERFLFPENIRAP